MPMILGEKARCYRIDLDADPVFVPEGFEVIEHRLGGVLEWNPKKPQIELYLTPIQRKGIADGCLVFEELKEFDGTMANANLLDFFVNNLAHKPWIMPDEWKQVELHQSKHILFWGTRYRFEGGVCVRSLEWHADAREHEWKSGYCWVDIPLNSQFPAAMIRRPAAVLAVPLPANVKSL
jgi:hypothetical protein